QKVGATKRSTVLFMPWQHFVSASSGSGSISNYSPALAAPQHNVERVAAPEDDHDRSTAALGGCPHGYREGFEGRSDCPLRRAPGDARRLGHAAQPGI